MKIVSVDNVEILPEDVKRLQVHGEVKIYDNVPTVEEGIKRIQDADIVIDNWFDIPQKVIKNAKKLRMISVAAV